VNCEEVDSLASIEKAIEVFAGGFSFTRSFTYPYLAERVGPLWVMRDAPRKRPVYRTEEWIAHGVAPQEVDRIATKTHPRPLRCLRHSRQP